MTYCSLCGMRDGRHWPGCTGEPAAPCDWDGESYCTVDGCTNPATHSSVDGITDDEVEVAELVCCLHAVRR